MRIIYGGHWAEAPKGWVSIPEVEQDLTKKLKQEDESVEVVFTEHVCEHLPFVDAIGFFKESFRVLKKGGIFRIAMPMIDKMITFQNNEIGKHYSDIQTKQYYKDEDDVLRELGLDGIRESPIAFMMDSLFKKHGHQFIWSAELLKKVLQSVGFNNVEVCAEGESFYDKTTCLERVIRGVDSVYVKSEFDLTEYDPETLVFEAIK